MRRAAAAVLALPLLAGCGVRPTGVVYAGDPPIATASPSSRAQVFLLQDGVPVPVERTVGTSDPQGVFDALLNGPNASERQKGLYTDLLEVRQIVVQRIGVHTLFVDTVPSPAKMSPAGYAQIYCTGAALPDRPEVRMSYLSAAGVKAYQANGCGFADAAAPTAAPLD